MDLSKLSCETNLTNCTSINEALLESQSEGTNWSLHLPENERPGQHGLCMDLSKFNNGRNLTNCTSINEALLESQSEGTNWSLHLPENERPGQHGCAWICQILSALGF